MDKRIAVVTGATGGIGLEVCKMLGKEGYYVVVNGIDKKQAKSAMHELANLGIEAELKMFDVTKEEEVDKGIKEVGEKFGRIDVLINNAGGLGGRSRFEDMKTSFYRSVMALNVDSAFFASRAAIPYLKKSKDASIIIYSTNAAWNAGGPGAGIYGTSKAAVTTLARALAKDLSEYGIRVNGVSPGTIDTPFHDGIRLTKPEVFATWKNNILMKRLGKPEEVAAVVSFLISDKASFLTGEIVQVNGGQDFL